jgi:YaiO family outer membrane protein
MARSVPVSCVIPALMAAALAGVPADASAQAPATSRWALTPIYTLSSVSGGRGDWNQFELDLQYQASPRVSLAANADWRERWGIEDTLYTGRVSIQATDALEWHASVTSTPDADFSPERIHATGLDWRLARRVSLLLDYRQLEFANGDLREWRPGAILWLSDRTWITARYSDGDAFGGTGYHASTLRLDHVFGGQQKLSVAYTRGLDPERDPLLPGVLLSEADAVSVFYRMPLRPALDLILGAEYEDRARAYTRTGISVGLVARF